MAVNFTEDRIPIVGYVSATTLGLGRNVEVSQKVEVEELREMPYFTVGVSRIGGPDVISP